MRASPRAGEKLDLERRAHASAKRRVSARFRASRRYPLLIVHDGRDFLEYASLKNVLDNLIHRLEMPEMIVALTDPGDRLIEYANFAPHARFLAGNRLARGRLRRFNGTQPCSDLADDEMYAG